MIQFTRVEPLGGTRWLHADAESKPAERGSGGRDETAAYGKPERVVISFGPEHAPLEQRQVELALEEAQHARPEAQRSFSSPRSSSTPRRPRTSTRPSGRA